MENALVFFRTLLGGVFRRATHYRSSRTRPWICLAANVPTKTRVDTSRLWETSKARRADFRIKNASPSRKCLIFTAVLVTVSMMPSRGSAAGTAQPTTEAQSEISEQGLSSLLQDTKKRDGEEESPTSANKTDTSDMSTPLPDGGHTEVHTTSTATAHKGPPKYPLSVEHDATKEKSEDVKVVQSAGKSGASTRKEPNGKSTLAPTSEEAVEKSDQSTKTFLDANGNAEQPLPGTQTTAHRDKVVVGVSATGDREEEKEGGKADGNNAAEGQIEPAGEPRGTETPEDLVTLDEWFEAIATASMNPEEAAAVAAELPVVSLSRYEQILVQQLLRQHGLTQLATHLQQTNKESITEFGKVAEDGVDRDKTLSKEVYNAAVEVVDAYRQTHPDLLGNTIQPLPSYEDVSKEQKDIIEQKAAEVIMLRVRDSMVAHAQKEYRERKDRLRQGLPSGPHFLLDVIERNKQKHRSTMMWPSLAQQVELQRPFTSGGGHGTPEGKRSAALHKTLLRDPTVLETPVWGFMERELAKLEEQYRSQGRLRGGVDNFNAGIGRTGSDEEALRRPSARGGDGHIAAVDPSYDNFFLQLQRIFQEGKEQNAFGHFGDELNNGDFQTVQNVHGGSKMDTAPGAPLTSRDDELEGLSEEDKVKLQLLQSILPESIEAWKAALTVEDPTVLALLEVLPFDMYLPDAPPEKRPAHPGAGVVDPMPSLFSQDAANLRVSETSPTVAHIKEIVDYSHESGSSHPEDIAANDRPGAVANEQIVTEETSLNGGPLKLPLMLGDHLLTYEGLQMHLAAKAKEKQNQRQAKNDAVPNTFPPSPNGAGGQTARKRLQATSTPSLEQFIVSKSKAAVQPEDATTTPSQELPKSASSVVQQHAEKDDGDVIEKGGPHGGQMTMMQETLLLPHTPQTEHESKPVEGGLTPEMLAEIAALLSPSPVPPPILLYLQQQLFPVPEKLAPQIEQTAPETDSSGTHEQHLQHPQTPVGVPPHAGEEAVSSSIGSEQHSNKTQDDTGKFLQSTAHTWGTGTVVGDRPSSSSAGEVAGAVDPGASTTPHVVPPALLPVITLKGSSGARQFPFGIFSGLDPDRMAVSGWRFSPPTPPALQTLPPQGMIPGDAEEADKETSDEELKRQQAQNVFLADPTGLFGPTPPPYSALVPPQYLPPYSSSGASASAIPVDYPPPNPGASQPFFPLAPSGFAPQLLPPHAVYPTMPTTDTHPTPPTNEKMVQLTYDAEKHAGGAQLHPLPAAPLAPSYTQVEQSHQLEGHLPAFVPNPGNERAEQLEDATATGRHMRTAGPLPSVIPLVGGGSALGTRQAVEAAATALPQLAQSAEQLMTTTSSLLSAGNALAKSLPIEEAAQLGQHLNDMRMRRREGPPMPSVGEPTVRCMTSGMICCVPQKAVGPEWKKKPPYLNDSSRSNRACQAHFVPLQDAVCAATEYDGDMLDSDKECGIQRIETLSTVVFKHSLHVRGPKRLTATCECHWKTTEPGKAAGDANTQTPNKAPGDTVEGFAHWEYSKKAAIEGQAARARTGKFLSGLGAALKATALLAEADAKGAESSQEDTGQQGNDSGDKSGNQRPGVSALADVLLEEHGNNPSMKYVKQALADIARATGRE